MEKSARLVLKNWENLESLPPLPSPRVWDQVGRYQEKERIEGEILDLDESGAHGQLVTNWLQSIWRVHLAAEGRFLSAGKSAASLIKPFVERNAD